ncbi:hypothetical protein SERLA73DRAFT_60044, partial [Serpula lacrymans var. lacrymans S7.3]
FVDRYGVLAHACLARHGIAPELLFCGLLDGEDDSRSANDTCGAHKCSGPYVGPLRIVVMDFIEGEHAHAISPAAWPRDTRAQIKEALIHLHREGLVFGDLRPPNNVLFTESKVVLIDLTGRVGRTRCGIPKSLSSHVQWPEALMISS